MKSKIESCQIVFSLTEGKVKEIKGWLLKENQKNGEGFYCNWNSIMSSFNKNKLATILVKNKPIGFVTWLETSDKTATIEITEIKPLYRKKGLGRELINHLLVFLKSKGICAIILQCSPITSEPFWKRMGFLEFPNLSQKINPILKKKLYLILIDSLQAGSYLISQETIELWNNELYNTDENSTPNYIWNINFIEGSRKLLKPIIHPANIEWRIRWKVKDKTITDVMIKKFTTTIDFDNFIIIDELKI